MLFSQARRRQVVNTQTATKVARVEGFVVLPDPPRVALLRMGKAASGGTLLAWDDVQAFGPDAVTVHSDTALRPARDALEQRAEDRELDVLGKRVLTERGTELGTITDVDFDAGSGAVTSLVTKTDTIPGDRLIGVGSYAVVVST